MTLSDAICCPEYTFALPWYYWPKEMQKHILGVTFRTHERMYAVKTSSGVIEFASAEEIFDWVEALERIGAAPAERTYGNVPL